MNTNFSSETVKARREKNDVFKVLSEKKKKNQPRIPYPAKNILQSEKIIQNPSNELKIKESLPKPQT